MIAVIRKFRDNVGFFDAGVILCAILGVIACWVLVKNEMQQRSAPFVIKTTSDTYYADSFNANDLAVSFHNVITGDNHKVVPGDVLEIIEREK